VPLPEFGFSEDTGKSLLCAIERAIQAREKPLQPWRDIQSVLLLGLFEDVVIGIALRADLRRHAVKALRGILGTRKRHIRNGSRNASVAVIKWMDGHKP